MKYTTFFSFRGRANRTEFLFCFALSFLVMAGFALSFDGREYSDIAYVVSAPLWLVPALAASVRRFHNTGESGWNVAGFLIPFINAVMLLLMFVMPGKPEANRYGPKPGRFAPPWSCDGGEP